MKTCPQCARVYADDMTFCLQDGSILIGGRMPTDPEEPTVLRPPRSSDNVPVAVRSGGWMKWAVPAVVLLLGAALAAVAAILFLRPLLVPSSSEQASSTSNSASNQHRGSENVVARPSPTTPATPAPTETPAKSGDDPERNNTSGSDDDEDDAGDIDFSDPGPARITFRRGSVGETVRGRISKERSFLLHTSAGQRLAARVRSPTGCVAFADGGTATGFSTPQGDSRVTIVNNCDRPARFTLSVTVR